MFLKAVFGLGGSMTDEERAAFTEHTGRTRPPTQPATRAWVVKGRRAGGSRIAALIAAFVAAFRDYSHVLAPGEAGVVAIIAADRRQARVIFKYVRAFFELVPALSALVHKVNKESIELTTGIVIEVHTCNFKTTRGYTLVAVIADELAFWNSDEAGASPDVEVINSLIPGLLTTGGLLLGISSPHARRGVLFSAWEKHWAEEDDPQLVWVGASLAMNPLLDASVVADAYAEDESVAAAEYGAEWRRDVEGYVSREVLADAVVPDRAELLPCSDIEYTAAADMSGGSVDSSVVAISHREGERAILDAVREIKAPHNPQQAVKEFCDLIRAYRCSKVIGDRYSARWVQDAYRACGVQYEVTEQSASDYFRDLLPMLNTPGRVELLDHRRLIAQLGQLERRTSVRGTTREIISHPPRGHDDVAAAAAIALVRAGRQPHTVARMAKVIGF